MRKSIFWLCSIMFFLTSTSAAAQNIYTGIDFINISYSESGGNEADLKAIRTKIGKLLTPNLAFEGHFGFGIEEDTIKVMGIDVNLEFDNGFGVYMLGILPAADVFKAYGIIGFTRGKATASVPGISISQSETDLSYGFGAEIMFSDHASAIVDYMQFIDKPDLEYSGLGIGVKIYF